ncbi:MAG: electron transfer flavoprotein subunit beta/FixA family protein [Planctomycetota bacterium]
MPYDSVVCIKQVPDTANVTGEAMKEDGTVNRAALPTIFNPDDLYALEMALQVRDRYGGTVTAISMGPPKAGDVLRDCLYRGADRVILLTDKRAAASDTLATSYILACAIRKVGRFDLVFCGRQAIDGDTAQVGPQCAEKLGVPQVTYLEEIIDISDGTAQMRRNVGNGWEVVEVQLPVLVTVLDSAPPVRPPAARRVMRFKSARVPVEVRIDVARANPDRDNGENESEALRRLETLRSRGLVIDEWNLDDIEADLNWCGVNGSPTKVWRIQSIVLTKEGYTEVPPTDEGIRQMVHELVIDHTLG